MAQLNLGRLAYGGNDLSVVIDFPVADPAAPVDVRLSGTRLDARQFLGFGAPGSDQPDPAAPTSLLDAPALLDAPTPAGLDEQPPGRPFHLTILRDNPVSQVIVTDTLAIEGLWGQMRHDGEKMRDAVLHATLPRLPQPTPAIDGPAPADDAVLPGAVEIIIEDVGPRRRFDVSADDLGTLLSILGLSQSVREGAIRADGVIDDVNAGNITGRVVVTDFRMIDAPLLGRVLTLPSLTGIANTLSGRGIAFDRGVFPFVLTDETLTIDDGRLRGSQLGILIKGTVDRVADTVDIRGEVAPATLINSMLNKVPIIGQVLTGGGEGIFAATYRINGPLGDPVVSVNPISVLAPGFIRNIVGGFSDEQLAVDDPDPYPDPDSDVQ